MDFLFRTAWIFIFLPATYAIAGKCHTVPSMHSAYTVFFILQLAAAFPTASIRFVPLII
jgi:hypothetical protein